MKALLLSYVQIFFMADILIDVGNSGEEDSPLFHICKKQNFPHSVVTLSVSTAG